MSEQAAPPITYAGYLALDEILGGQRPLSEHHDELLFIVVHQTKELWLKQIIAEIGYAQTEIRSGRLVPAYKSLARVSRIQSVMTQSWDVLATMTPADYLQFRGGLGTSSGFQSDQFRRLEFMLGLKDPAFLKHHQDRPAAHAELERALHAPSLYDDALAQLAAQGAPVPKEALNKPPTEPHRPSAEIEAAWL
ncbi:MAG: tryptophan 2,3-dioxygenase family protein, partial [Pseudomonadota bacterium]|nr:tryptophan 2,3-dioxygenase family protein [Pseudomonadota bacterium]